MSMLTTVGELVDYNYWARDRQLRVCATVTHEEFLRPLGASFTSLRDSLSHLVGVEWIWLERWQGRSPQSLPPAEEFASLQDISARWKTVEQNLRKFVAGLDEEKLLLPFTYTNSKGETWSYPLWNAFLHVVNHQSYHRGQVTMLLRLLGKQPPQVDFLVAYDMGFRC